MYNDLKRICERPTDEDRQWFPEIAGSAWVADARPRDAQLQGRELHRPVPEPEDDARVPRCSTIVDDEKESELEVSRHPRRLGLPACARGAVAPVRPRFARAQHPGVERQPARRPLHHACATSSTTTGRWPTARRRCSSTWRGCGASACSSRASTRPTRSLAPGR